MFIINVIIAMTPKKTKANKAITLVALSKKLITLFFIIKLFGLKNLRVFISIRIRLASLATRSHHAMIPKLLVIMATLSHRTGFARHRQARLSIYHHFKELLDIKS